MKDCLVQAGKTAVSCLDSCCLLLLNDEDVQKIIPSQNEAKLFLGEALEILSFGNLPGYI